MERLSRRLLIFCFAAISSVALGGARAASTVFYEQNGLVAAEAEDYFLQTSDSVRKWYLTTADQTPNVTPDADPNHVTSIVDHPDYQASGGAYLELLPDTRQTHNDALINGQNFSNVPGALGVLHYKVNFTTTGRYYVWGRIFSTGAEDNSLHVGIDNTWPDSGQRMQWTIKHSWAWESKQRTAEVHTGVPYQLYLDVLTPGEHTIMFSMREDGVGFDKWVMSTDRNYTPYWFGPDPVVPEPVSLLMLAPLAVAGLCRRSHIS